jgi:hypothetical protein
MVSAGPHALACVWPPVAVEHAVSAVAGSERGVHFTGADDGGVVRWAGRLGDASHVDGRTFC